MFINVPFASIMLRLKRIGNVEKVGVILILKWFYSLYRYTFKYISYARMHVNNHNTHNFFTLLFILLYLFYLFIFAAHAWEFCLQIEVSQYTCILEGKET